MLKNDFLAGNERFFSSLDRHFAAFMSRLAGRDSAALRLAAALVSKRIAEGHICLNLAESAGRPWAPAAENGNAYAGENFICPELADWSRQLLQSGVTGRPGEYKPLVLDDQGRLYFHRYWEYETAVADFIKKRGAAPTGDIDFSLLAAGLRRLFPPALPEAPSRQIDWQKIAAIAAMLRPFCVITGGPGTGKTFTVAKILALLLEQARGRGRLRIVLAAPTGKAAVRLQEALGRARTRLQTATETRDAIPAQVLTLHRLLGPIPGSPYFRFNSDNPLPADVIVVDEASMVDLPMMAKLMAAVPAAARLIILGDRDQLASVEPGAVLGDICRPDYLPVFSEEFRKHVLQLAGQKLKGHKSGPPIGEKLNLQDSIVELRQSFRFAPDSGIRALSRAVNQGDADTALAVLADGKYTDIALKATPPPAELEEMLLKSAVVAQHPAWAGSSATVSPAAAFAALDRGRILCALRKGPYGVDSINRTVERILAGKKLIAADRPDDYPGRPVMINQNSYALQLYNGDVGIFLTDPEAEPQSPAQSAPVRVFFPDPAGGSRKFLPMRLPPHETVYAMTVHKSQGSEFDDILLILPDGTSPVLTRELIYTAITRARKTVEIRGGIDVVRRALAAGVKRESGLQEKLWGL